MVPKIKNTAPPSTHKKGGGQFKRKPQPPPQFQSDTELLSPEEDQPNMRDVIKTLGALTTAIAATNAKVNSVTKHGVPHVPTSQDHPGSGWPSDVENQHAVTSTAEPGQANLKEQVHIRVTKRVISYYPSFLATTGDKSDGEEEKQPQLRRRYITSGRLITVDTTAVNQVLWPHELVFTPDGRTTVYNSISCMAFMNRYLSIMALQMDILRNKMTIHLQEMMEDGKTFRWPVVHAYHVAWLQHLEQGRATWDYEATRLKLRRVFFWHSVVPPPEPHLSADQPTQQPTASTRAQRCTGPSSDPGQPGDRACADYNKWLYVTNDSRSTRVQFLPHSAQRLSNHREQHCRCKSLAKNEEGGF